ncbi:hypothetical protein ACS0TY_029806 [Phlomoides rotata]
MPIGGTYAMCAPIALDSKCSRRIKCNSISPRTAYQPQPPPRRSHHRGCCCLWMTLLIIILIFLVAIGGIMFYVLYRPHRHSFSVNSLQLSRFNLTNTSLTSSFNFYVTV